MKIKHAIVAAAFLFMAGCETTGNTTGSGSTSSTNAGTTSATAGTSTSGNTNPASNSTNARGTLTDGSTATSGTTTGTTTSANNANSATQNSANPANTNSTTSTMSGTTSSANNANTSTTNSTSANQGTTASGTTPSGTTNNSMNQASGTTSGSFSVPSSHQSAFTTRYPTASNVQWSRYNSADVPIDWEMTGWAPLDNNDYVVRYNVGADPYYSWYDSEGNWIGTAAAMKNVSSLPAAVNTLVSTKYKGYTISSVNTEYWKDRTAYEIEMKNATSKAKVLVDANGTVLKEKMKMQ